MQHDSDHLNWQKIQENLDWMDQKQSQYILHINDERYPKLLKQIDDPPILLWVTTLLHFCLFNFLRHNLLHLIELHIHLTNHFDDGFHYFSLLIYHHLRYLIPYLKQISGPLYNLWSSTAFYKLVSPKESRWFFCQFTLSFWSLWQWQYSSNKFLGQHFLNFSPLRLFEHS